MFQKILLPTDLSAEGERAFRTVSEFARERKAKLVLLHVVENVGSPPIGEKFKKPALVPGTRQELERVRAGLEERKQRLGGGLDLEIEVLVAPSVPHAIRDYAAQRGCDLIALSTHGRSGFRRLIVGSVTEALLRNVGIPVLVFPRQE
jgi:nucleotide-binding universal stress UspA family protein